MNAGLSSTYKYGDDFVMLESIHSVKIVISKKGFTKSQRCESYDNCKAEKREK